MNAVLGFDIGTSAVKVIAVSLEGDVLASASSAVTAYAPAPGRLEEKPEDWWTALGEAANRAAALLPRGTGIRAIGLSGHMSGLVLLDRSGRPVMPCVLLADTRGSEEAASLQPAVRDRIVAQTGNRPSEVFTLAKLLWARRHEPARFERAAWAVSAKDFVLARLTGNVSTERTDAGNYLLLDAGASRWDEELMRSLALPPALFPPLRLPSEKAGELSAAAAHHTGLAPGIPVVAGGADMACTAVGSGILSAGDAAMSLGTASPVIIPVPGIDPALVGKLTFHPHALAGSRYALASILSGGRSYQWLRGILREAGAGALDFGAMDRHAAASPPGSRGVLFLPFLTGTGSPDWRAHGRAAWLGMDASTGLADLARAVMEGAAYNCRECLRLAAGRPSRLVVSGGGAGSALWPRILADVTGLAVQTVSTRDASALGAAVLAGVGSGEYRDIPAAVSGMVRLGATIEPDSRTSVRYAELSEAWLLAKRQLAAVDDAAAAARSAAQPGGGFA